MKLSKRLAAAVNNKALAIGEAWALLEDAAQLVEAVELTLDEIQEHPMFMGYDASDEDIDSEGGDAAFVTVIGIRLNSALAGAK